MLSTLLAKKFENRGQAVRQALTRAVLAASSREPCTTPSTSPSGCCTTDCVVDLQTSVVCAPPSDALIAATLCSEARASAASALRVTARGLLGGAASLSAKL